MPDDKLHPGVTVDYDQAFPHSVRTPHTPQSEGLTLVTSPEHEARILGKYDWPYWGWPHEYAPMHGQGVTVAYMPRVKMIGGILQPVLKWMTYNYLVLPQ